MPRQCSNKSKYHDNPLYICNTVSGRYVLRSGPAGQKILGNVGNAGKPCNQNLPKATDPLYKCNPKTGRWIKHRSKKKKPVVHGPAGKQHGPVKKPCSSKSKYANNTDYGCNHSSGRWMKMDTPLGRKLFPQLVAEVCNIDLFKQYPYNTLVKKAAACGIDLEGKKIRMSLLRNMIDWNQRSKCSNEHTLLGDEIKDIPAREIIRINGVCYPVDEVFGYINANKLKNVDPYSPHLKLWTTDQQLEDMVGHIGLDKDLLKNYKKELKEIENQKAGIFNNPDAPKIIRDIGIAGFICLNDSPNSFSEEAEQFKYAQVILPELIEIINKLPQKDKWLTTPTTRGLTLASIFNTMANNCIHGIGFKLLNIFGYMYFTAKNYGVNIELPKIFEVKPGKKIITFNLTGNKGLDDDLNNNLNITEVTINYDNTTRTYKQISIFNKKRFLEGAQKIKDENFNFEEPEDPRYVKLSDCQDDSDYLSSMDDLKDFPKDEIISIKLDGHTHCFPKQSIARALKLSTPIFASPSVRYAVGQVLNDFYPGLVVDEHQNQLVDKADELVKMDLDGLNDKDYVSKLLIAYFRLYKWPLGPTMAITFSGLRNILHPEYKKYKMVKIGRLKDVSSLQGSGVGAMHGPMDIYDVIPIGEHQPINRKNKIVKKNVGGMREWIFSSPHIIGLFKVAIKNRNSYVKSIIRQYMKY